MKAENQLKMHPSPQNYFQSQRIKNAFDIKVIGILSNTLAESVTYLGAIPAESPNLLFTAFTSRVQYTLVLLQRHCPRYISSVEKVDLPHWVRVKETLINSIIESYTITRLLESALQSQ